MKYVKENQEQNKSTSDFWQDCGQEIPVNSLIHR